MRFSRRTNRPAFLERPALLGGIVVAFLLCVPRPPPALGQVAPAEVARRLVAEGIEAASARDWVKARERFARAYDIQPVPLTLYNLATAQEKTGLLVEADRSYRVFLRDTKPGQHDDFRRVAAEHRRLLRARIAYLTVEAPNLVETDILRVGDQELAHAVVGRSLPANPGPLRILVERDGTIVAADTVTLAEGASRKVTLEVPPFLAQGELPAVPEATAAALPRRGPAALEASSGSVAAEAGAERPGGGSITDSPWFWVVTGALAVGGGAVGLIFALQGDDPYPSTLEPVRVEGR